MGSIAQAVSSSAVSATNSPNTEPTAAQHPANVQPETSPLRAHDTVDLTETGSRNVSVGLPGVNASAAFQVAYFPASSSPDAQARGATSNASHSAVSAVGVSGSASPTAQVASAAAQAIANTSVTASSAATKVSALTRDSATNLSQASQAKLAQLNQVLQRLGINPTQISFADRLSLLPLVNDPQALQQFVQGLPQRTAVLDPATSQVSAPSIISNLTSSPNAGSADASTPDPYSVASATATAVAATSTTSVQSGASSAPPVEPTRSARTHERIGQNLNISV